MTWPSLTCQWFPDMESYAPLLSPPLIFPTLANIYASSSSRLLIPSPFPSSPPNADYTLHRILLGTHTSGQSQDHLIIAQVQIPKPKPASPATSSATNPTGLSEYDDTTGEIGSHSSPSAPPARIKVIQSINHDGEINRARYMPQNPNILATKTISGDVYVFDRTKHASEPAGDGICKPDIRLKGQSKEGWVRPFFSAER
jgi:histone-binding protein RBBP4